MSSLIDNPMSQTLSDWLGSSPEADKHTVQRACGCWVSVTTWPQYSQLPPYVSECEHSIATLRSEEDCRDAQYIADHQRRIVVSRKSRLVSWQTLEAFDTSASSEIAQAYKLAERFATRATQHSRRGLALIGPPGTGKTHLLNAISLKLIDRGHEVRYVRLGQFFSALKEAIDSPTRSPDLVLSAYQHVAFLALDDVGVESLPLDSWRGEQLHSLVDERYAQGRPLLLSTNMEPDALAGYLGGRLYDRVREMCLLVPVRGPSYRARRADSLDDWMEGD